MRRIINFIGWMHHKNVEGAKLFNEFDVEFDGESRDIVVNSGSIDGIIGNVTIYGPNIDLYNISKIQDYPINMLSQWNIECVKKINPNSNAIALPFPVNTDRFIPADKDGIPIVYFKRRDITLLNDVIEHMSNKFEKIRFFDYENGYNESDYIDSCSKAPFCVWLGSHESQGFALQECLSSNTPILVIDVNYLTDEIPRFGEKYWKDGFGVKVTSAPYFDERCGIITDFTNWKNDLELFINKIDEFSPRQYVLENLSTSALTKKWTEIINK